MATFEVTLERITVFPHPNADRLELARVGMFNSVVGKGQFKTGDTVFYIPEQAVVPEKLQKILNVEGKLAGSKKDRVKATRLRGELSQGLVLDVDKVFKEYHGTPGFMDMAMDVARYDEHKNADDTYRCERDFAEFFGIIKWEPVLPPSMDGVVGYEPDLVSWIDIENIKKFPELFANGEEVVATEKVHGTATIINVFTDGRVFVTSKGQGNKSLVIQEDNKNLYWAAVRRHNLVEVGNAFTVFAEDILGTELKGVALYGETYGTGVQDLGYGTEGGTGFALFDVRAVLPNGDTVWLNHDQVYTDSIDVPRSPVIFRGGYDFAAIDKISDGKEQVSGKETNIREGVVVRPVTESTDRRGRRRIAKFVTETYLTRKGGTEYN